MSDSKAIKDTLDRLLIDNDSVFIVPHNNPDFDAISAAIGMALICKKKKKRTFIVINDDYEKLQLEIEKELDEVRGKFDIITAGEVPELVNDKSLMIAVDVNKANLVSTKPYLDSFHDILIIDHHKTDENTIKTPNTFIESKVTSTSEKVADLIFQYGIKLTPDYANYLLAGMMLDSNGLKNNVSDDTYFIAGKLKKSGADPSIANNMFLEDFERDRAIQRLVDNTDFPTYSFAIACDKENSGRIYQIEDIAKAADYLLKYKVNATFAMAHIDDDTISISARSKGIVDVASIMKLFGGGGNEHSAAARVKGVSINELKMKLSQILVPTSLLSNKGLDNGIFSIKDTNVSEQNEKKEDNIQPKLIPLV